MGTMLPDAPKNGAEAVDRLAVEDAASLESQVVTLAEDGVLSEAARGAIRSQIQLGLPVTFKRGNLIIKQHPDGREEEIGRVPRTAYTLPKGIAIIGNK